MICTPSPRPFQLPKTVSDKIRSNGVLTCSLLAVGKDETVPIVWSYSVKWEPSDIAWASRWDTYLTMADPQIHWFSIINSLVTVIFLTGSCHCYSDILTGALQASVLSF